MEVVHYFIYLGSLVDSNTSKELNRRRVLANSYSYTLNYLKVDASDISIILVLAYGPETLDIKGADEIRS